MEKTDAIRKVKGLEALAADEGASEQERAAATATATKLREKYEVTDADIEGSEPFIFFGSDIFFFYREIQPLLKKAEEAINEALAKADAAPLLRDKVETYAKIHQAVKHAAEETGSPHGMRNRLKSRRNAVIREAITQEFEEYYRTYTEGEELSEDYQAHYRNAAMSWAIWRVAMECDLRKDVVERIARRTR